MNKFDRKFFQKYVPEWNEILWIVHEHFIVILDKLIISLSFWVFFPAFLFKESILIQNNLPFIALEVWLILVFIKLLYDIFDRYNDVFIITDSGVIDLKWSLLDVNNVSVKHENIEWVEVVQKWLMDSLLWKWDIVIHKVWSDNFILQDAVFPYKAVDQIELAWKWKVDPDEENFFWWEENPDDWNFDFNEDDFWWWDFWWENEEITHFWEDEHQNQAPQQHHGNYNDEVIQVLSEIVKWHLDKKWYPDKEKQEKIEEAKKRSDTIDLS